MFTHIINFFQIFFARLKYRVATTIRIGVHKFRREMLIQDKRKEN